MDILRPVLRWAASAPLMLVALLAVIASLALQFLFGNLVEPPRPALLSLLILFALPVALVGWGIYVASAWLYRGDRQLSWVVHIQHTWMLYTSIGLAAYRRAASCRMVPLGVPGGGVACARASNNNANDRRTDHKSHSTNHCP